MSNLNKRLLDTDFALSMFTQWDGWVFVVAGLAMIILARFLHVVPFWFLTGEGVFQPSKVRMNTLLITDDNKAVAISLASFILGLGIVMSGQANSTGSNQEKNVAQLFIWVPITFFLLFLARFFNLYMIVGRRATAQLLAEKNIAVALVEAGSVIGSSFVVRATTSGDGSSVFLEDLGSTMLFFVAGQAFFVAWAAILSKLVMRIDLEDVLCAGNVAAGASVGLNLLAFGFILSIPVANTDSIWGFLAWVGFSVIVVLALRFIVNKVILFGQDLDKEILVDQNYGVAMVEGVSMIFIALACDTFVGTDTENNVVQCGV